MKKLDSFFITIVTLVLALTGVYYYSYKNLNYFESDPKLKAKLERRVDLLSLEKKLNDIARSSKINRRVIASLPDNGSSAKQENSSAEKYYLQAKKKCYELNAEAECIQIIESSVTHFPGSNWTGESLVLLTEFYYRTKHVSYIRDILKILKQDFKNNKSIQKKVAIIERELL